MFGKKRKIRPSRVAEEIIWLKTGLIETVNKTLADSSWRQDYRAYPMAIDIHFFLLSWFAIRSSPWPDSEKQALCSELVDHWVAGTYSTAISGFQAKRVKYVQCLQAAIIEYSKRQESANRDKNKENSPLIVMTEMVGFFDPIKNENEQRDFTIFLFMMCANHYELFRDLVTKLHKQFQII